MSAKDVPPLLSTVPILLDEDLGRLSEAELDDRLARLRNEIARVETERDSRSGVRAAADALFRK